MRRADVERFRPPDEPVLRLASIAAAAGITSLSRGDVFLLPVLLGVAAARVWSGIAAGLVMLSVALRWGSSSFRVLASNQAVLGPAGTTGSELQIASAWCAAAALIVAVAPLRRGSPVACIVVGLPFSLAAAAVVAGPGAGGAVGVRVAASCAAVVLAAVVAIARQHRAIDQFAAVGSVVIAAAAVALVVVHESGVL